MRINSIWILHRPTIVSSRSQNYHDPQCQRMKERKINWCQYPYPAMNALPGTCTLLVLIALLRPTSAGGENNFIYKFLYLHPPNPHPVHAELILNHQSFNTTPGCITGSCRPYWVYNSPISQIPNHEECNSYKMFFEHDNSRYCCWIRRRRRRWGWGRMGGIEDVVLGIELLSEKNINWC